MKENIEDAKSGESVSVSLHTLEMKMRGVQGLAKTLQTDLKVTHLQHFLRRVVTRLEYKAHRLT